MRPPPPQTNQVKNIDGRGSDVNYDARGNVTSMLYRDLRTVEHDALTGKTRRIERDDGHTVRYQYGPDGSRVYRKDVQSGSERLYLRGRGGQSLVEIAGGTKMISVYGATGRVARKSDGSWSYLIKDHLGSVRAVVGEGGGADRLEYGAFGLLRRDEAGGDVRYTYTGQEYERAIASGGKGGLMNYGARMYDPYLGRFLSVDPAGQFHSPYVYAGNNPVRMVDPNGRFVVLGSAILGGIVAGAAIGAGVSGAAYAATTAIQGEKWSWKAFGTAAAYGAAAGAISGGVSAAGGGGLAGALGLEGGPAAGAVNGAASGAFSGATSYATQKALTGNNFSFEEFGEKTGLGALGGFFRGGVSQHLGNWLQGFADNGGAQFALARAATGGTASASSAAVTGLIEDGTLLDDNFSVPIGQGAVSIGFDGDVLENNAQGVWLPYGAGLVDAGLTQVFNSGSVGFNWHTMQFQVKGQYATRLSTLVGSYPFDAASLNGRSVVGDFFGTTDFKPTKVMMGEVGSTLRDRAMDYLLNNRPYTAGVGGLALWTRLHMQDLFWWEQPGSSAP